MLLGFHGATKLKTKKIIYEKVYSAHNSSTLDQLEELSSKRQLIEEFMNQKSNITEAIAKDTSRGMTSQTQQYLQKLEQYLPLLANLVEQNSHKTQHFVSLLKIRWSSALSPSSCILGTPKFFQIDNLLFEQAMSISLYGAFLRERAFEILSTEDLVESATFFRKASGVYNYLAGEVLPSLLPSLPKERPAEATTYFSSVMSLICLADAQAVTAKKAEEKGSSPMLLSKLHYGVTKILDEATSVMKSKSGEWKDISSKHKEILSLCKVLHELRSQRYLAEDLKAKEQIGIAIALLRYAVANAKHERAPTNETAGLVFSKEMKDLREMLRKLEHENELVWYQRVPGVDKLPTLEGQSIVKAIPYEPQTCKKLLSFCS